MTKEALLEGLLGLPTKDILPLREPEDHEIIEGNDENIHYKMARDAVNLPGAPCGLVVFSLSVSGPKTEQLKFIDELTKKLGSPLANSEDPKIPGIQFALWDARDVEQKLASKN